MKMKATPRASFVVSVDAGLCDQKVHEIALIMTTLLKGMTEAPVNVTFQRHFKFQEERSGDPFSASY
ncbi:hypothetical protein [Streptomyces sp. NPDC048057]|uniref:hypothetical protein n=1 Tax=Streptomyces sp. NPDC048057 TaxID=3155628 RepID=UPI00340C51AF